jgi:uncharacterized Zn finger protein (UPF0148 family)
MSTKRDTKRDSVQRLLPEGGVICEGCGNVVKFKLRSSKPCRTQPGRMIAYLYCPICGHKATQIRVARRARKHIRYVYEP